MSGTRARGSRRRRLRLADEAAQALAVRTARKLAEEALGELCGLRASAEHLERVDAQQRDDELVADADGETLSHCLAEIVRIRSVQDMRPSTALSFLFLLKNVISRVLKNDLRKPSVARELEWVEKRIDSMALFTFDLYSRCRERVYEVRVNDIKRNVSSLLKRSPFFNSDNETDSNAEANLDLNHEPGKD